MPIWFPRMATQLPRMAMLLVTNEDGNAASKYSNADSEDGKATHLMRMAPQLIRTATKLLRSSMQLPRMVTQPLKAALLFLSTQM